MKVYVLMLVVALLILSCNSKKTNNQESNIGDTATFVMDDSLNVEANNSRQIISTKDTVLFFSIDGLSAEGSEAKVHYVKDTIKDATWNIFGETGQAIINYTFLENGTIKVQEKQYTYKSDLTEVNSEKDMKLKNSLQYLLDTNGNLLSKLKDKEFVNVFADFKKKVPMKLSQYKSNSED